MRIVNGRFDGIADLQQIAEHFGHNTIPELVLARVVFSPASIVNATQARPIVNAVRRNRKVGERRRYVEPARAEQLWGIRSTDPKAPGVYVDDNSAADFAFQACFTVRREQTWTQICHIFPGLAGDPRYFSSLANLALVPSWLAKLTDNHPDVQQAMKWVVRTAHSFCPHCAAINGTHCSACRMPDVLALKPETAHALVARYEHIAVKNYDAAARSITKDKRWQRAIAAGLGYTLPYLRPNPGTP